MGSIGTTHSSKLCRGCEGVFIFCVCYHWVLWPECVPVSLLWFVFLPHAQCCCDMQRYCERTDELSDLHNLEHLLTTDVPVAIKIVHAERPFQLLVQFSPWSHTQSDDELPEVDGAVVVGVKGSENVLCKLGGVAIWKKVGIYLLELLHVQVATWAVFKKSLRENSYWFIAY